MENCDCHSDSNSLDYSYEQENEENIQNSFVKGSNKDMQQNNKNKVWYEKMCCWFSMNQQEKFRRAVKYCHNKSHFHKCMSKKLKGKERGEKSRFGIGVVKKGNIKVYGIGFVRIG